MRTVHRSIGTFLAAVLLSLVQSAATPLYAHAAAASANTTLLDVSCTAGNSCIAVGEIAVSHRGNQTLAEVWNGNRWTIKSTPTPEGTFDSLLYGVSCSSRNACTAVGKSTSRRSGRNSMLVERWNGRRWTIQRAPNPAGYRRSILYSVSCPAARACTAVGAYVTRGGVRLTIAEAWNGRTWRIQTTRSPRAAVLEHVSCSTSRACMAVGYSGARIQAALAERWDGKRWTVLPTPGPAGYKFKFLFGDSCSSRDACTAVGVVSYGASPLVERWNGKRWTVEQPPGPTSQTGGDLHGVWCASAAKCIAVGQGSHGTLAERWNGKRWTVQPTPNPSGSVATALLSVSCSSSSACTAVGPGNARGKAVAERWNGRRWVLQPTAS